MEWGEGGSGQLEVVKGQDTKAVVRAVRTLPAAIRGTTEGSGSREVK